MRTLDIALAKIDRRQHNTFALRASLQGVKVPFRERATDAPELTEAQEMAADNALRAAIERKRLELERRG